MRMALLMLRIHVLPAHGCGVPGGETRRMPCRDRARTFSDRYPIPCAQAMMEPGWSAKLG